MGPKHAKKAATETPDDNAGGNNPLSKASTATSLQQLLALDHDFASFDERLGHAARIAGVREGWESPYSQAQYKEPERLRHHARAEWVLRWLLEKLKSQENIGLIARSNARAWMLLGRLLSLVPTSNAARLLNANQILSSVERSLEENLNRQVPFSAHHALQNTHEGAMAEREGSESSVTVEQQRKTSNKRKRPGSIAESVVSAKRPALGASSLVAIFQAIVQTFDGIAALAKNTGGAQNAVTAEHVKSVLRTDSLHAARLLRLWLSAIRTVMEHDPSLDVSLLLSPMLTAWNTRTIDKNDESGISAEVFCSECLVPAAQLMSSLSVQQVNQRADHRHGVQHNLSRSLERLLVSHLFLPARAAFFATGDPNVASRNTTKSDKLALRHLIEPLHHEIARSASSAENGEGHRSEKRPLSAALPPMFQVAIKCAPRSTPRRRIAEAPWLQTVFIDLVKCAGVSSSEQGPKDLTPEASQVLRDMLEVCCDEKVSLDSTLLADIVRWTSGLYGDTADAVHWPLIAKIVALDPNIFLGSNKPKTGTNQLAKQDIEDKLFAKITTLHWSSRYSETHWIPSDNQTEERTSADLGPSKGQVVPNDVSSTILVPVMRAFARNRSLSRFLSKWFQQLSSATWDVQTQVYVGSLLESEDLMQALGPLLESTMTSGQIMDLISKRRENISSFFSLLQGQDIAGALSQSLQSQAARNFMASLVILNAVISGISSDGTVAQSNAHLLEIFLHVTSLFENVVFQEECHGAHALAWRLLTSLYSLISPLWDGPTLEAEGKKLLESPCFEVALASAQGADIQTSRTTMPRAVEAFTLISTVCNSLLEIPGTQQSIKHNINLAMRPLMREVKLVNIVRRKTASEARLDHSDEETSRHEDCMLELSYPLMCFSNILKVVPSEKRRAFFKSVYANAFSETISPSHAHRSGGAYSLLLQLVSDYTFSAAPADIREDFLAVLYTGLEPDPESLSSLDSQLLDRLTTFTEDVYLQLSLVVLPRRHRETILDHLLAIVRRLRSSTLDASTVSRHLALIAGLMEVPNATAKISTDRSVLFELANMLDESGSAASEAAFEIFEEIVRFTLSHHLSTQDQSRSQAYLRDFNVELRNTVSNIPSFQARPGTLRLVKAALIVMYQQKGREKDHMVLLEKISKPLQTDLDAVVSPEHSEGVRESSCSTLALFDAVSVLPPDMLRNNTALLEKLFECRIQWTRDSSEQTWPEARFEDNQGHACVALYRALSRVQTGVNAASYAVQLLREDLSVKDYHVVLEYFRKWFSGLSQSEKEEALSSLLPKNLDEESGAEILGLVFGMVSSFTDQSSSPEAAKGLLSGRLCVEAQKTTSIRCFALASDTINLILREKAWLVSQWGIDTLLSTLITIASPSGPKLPPDQAGSIYLRLCETTQNMISLHRTKLGGRFHLLMPLLQTLLARLFVPDTRHNAATTASLPPWFDSRTALEATHATAYARLLTTLCSPTVSSVSTKHKRHQDASLVDETKKARAYAGQFTPNILMQFCSCQLSGRLKPEVGAALMPGLFAVMDVVGLEAMRALNSGMDASGRAIWRSLYGEWKRLGGWKER